MQQQGNTALAAMFANPGALTVTSTATPGGVSKDVTAFASEFVVTRELAGDLPDSVSLVGGAVSASVKIKADGKMPTAPHPLKAADRAAWLGAPVDLAAGYDGVTVPVFSGRLREFGFDESAYALTMTLMENADRMRAPMSLPLYGATSSRSLPLNIRRAPTNLSAVIVAALHASGIRMTPVPRPSCILSVPLTFGLIADIGWVAPTGNSTLPTSWLVAGKFAPMPTGLPLTAHPSRLAYWDTNTTVQGEAWYNHAAGVAHNLPAIGEGFRIKVDTAGAYFIQARSSGAVWNDIDYSAGRTLTAGWQHLAWETNWGGVFKMWRNGVLVSSGSVGYSPSLTGVFLSGDTGRIQALNLYYTLSGGLPASVPPTTITAFTAEANVDQSLLEVESLPPIDGRVAWEVCKEVAVAELGMVGWSETGRFYFKNRDTLNGTTTPVATYSTDLVENLTGSASVDSVRTRVTASVSPPWLHDAGRGAGTPSTTAVPSFIAKDPLVFPVGNSSHLLYSDTPFVSDESRVSRIVFPGTAWDVSVGMVLCQDSLGATRATDTFVLASIHPLGPSTWRLDVYNASAGTRYAVWPQAWTAPTYSGEVPFGMEAGAPALWVNGYSLGDKYPVKSIDVSNAGALATWGDRTFELGQSEWRQSATGVNALAVELLADLVQPRAELSDITVPADLRLQVGDPVLLTDWQGRLPSVSARVTRLVSTIGRDVENGMTNKLELRTLVGA